VPPADFLFRPLSTSPDNDDNNNDDDDDTDADYDNDMSCAAAAAAAAAPVGIKSRCFNALQSPSAAQLRQHLPDKRQTLWSTSSL